MSSSSNLGQAAKSHAMDLAQQVSDAATASADAQAQNVKDAAASKVQTVADAASAAASELDPAAAQAQAMHQVADQIETIAGKVRTADLGHLAQQATQVARAHPLVFLGGAAIAGFAVARFLKARDTAPRTTAQPDDPWAAPDHTSVLAQINGGRTDV